MIRTGWQCSREIEQSEPTFKVPNASNIEMKGAHLVSICVDCHCAETGNDDGFGNDALDADGNWTQ